MWIMPGFQCKFVSNKLLNSALCSSLRWAFRDKNISLDHMKVLGFNNVPLLVWTITRNFSHVLTYKAVLANGSITDKISGPCHDEDFLLLLNVAPVYLQ